MTGVKLSMKVSVSLPQEDVEFLDGFARVHGHSSRSAALHEAVRLLRASELGDDYDGAWQEFASSGDAALWDATTGDGVIR
jgi:Arc/MetJ-type ribon-helix-helix transcriptional regulator